MPSTKNPTTLTPGPGLLPEASVPEAALTFPVGGGGVGGSTGGLAAHLADPVGAHNAVAIQLQPDAGNFDEANVQSALDELGGVAPLVNELGAAGSGVPNSAVPTWASDAFRATGGFRNSPGYAGLGATALVESFNILPFGSDLTVTVKVYPADRGVIGLLRIDPDGTEVDIGVKLDLAAAFTEATRDTGQADFADLNPGMYDLTLEDRMPVLSAYPANPGLEVYETDYKWFQVGILSITLFDGFASFVTGHYRLLHVEDGEPFTSAGAQFGISVPTPGAVPLDPENVLMRERVFESGAVAPVFIGAEPIVTPDVTVSPPSRIPSSGVFAYGIGDTLDLSAGPEAANNCFDTGADVAGDVTLAGGRDPVQYDMSDFGVAAFGFAFDETIEGHSAAVAPDLSDNFTNGPTSITVGSGTVNDDADRDAQFVVTLNRPGVSSVVGAHAVPTEKMLVSPFNTSLTSARNAEEKFGRDEPYRHPQDTDLGSVAVAVGAAGVYASTTEIDSGPGGVADALQVGFGKLIWPQDDYTAGHFPTADQPDYSPFAADPTGTVRFYQRVFELSSYTQRGTIEIDGVTLADFGKADGEVYDSTFWSALLAAGVLSASQIASRAGPVLVLLRIPGISGWMDLGTFRGDGSTDITTDGIGCLSQDLGGGQFEFDLGWSPAASADGSPVPHLAVRVYYFMDSGSTVLTKETDRIAFV